MSHHGDLSSGWSCGFSPKQFQWSGFTSGVPLYSYVSAGINLEGKFPATGNSVSKMHDRTQTAHAGHPALHTGRKHTHTHTHAHTHTHTHTHTHAHTHTYKMLAFHSLLLNYFYVNFVLVYADYTACILFLTGN